MMRFFEAKDKVDFNLTMTSCFNIKNSLRLFWVVYFLIFAVILPFSHCHADSENHFHNAECNKILPFFSDYTCCEFHPEKNDSRHDHHSHFLLEKAGTNNRSNPEKVQKSESLNYVAILKDQTTLYLKPLFVNISQYIIVKSVDGFLALYSGLSPPII